MKRFHPLAWFVACTFAATPLLAAAHEFKVGDIRVLHPMAAPSLRGVPNGVGYASLVNGGPTGDRLLRLSSPVAQRVEVHSMQSQDGVMRMRAVDPLDVPAGQTVRMAAGGLHLMFVGLKGPLAPGDKFPVTLGFEKAGDVTIEMHVDKPASEAGSGAAAASHTH